MSLNDTEVVVSVCANCGKEGDDVKNICNKCNQVKYCNAICKKVHKKKHKKACEEYIRLATEKHDEEVRIAAKLHDEKLFKQPPPAEDCPICFLCLPTLHTGSRYKSCCGKIICCGCVYAPVYDNQGNEVAEKTCPFCRVPIPEALDPKSNEEIIEREKKRFADNDPIAVYNYGVYHRHGRQGLAQDHVKALELWHRAGELGYARAYGNIGYAYEQGSGVEVDYKKAICYWELAAIEGDSMARNNLGICEGKAGNHDRALKHFLIAVRGGNAESLNQIKQMYNHELATKDAYTRALQLYQAYLGEIKSPQRDEAAAAHDEYRYY